MPTRPEQHSIKKPSALFPNKLPSLYLGLCIWLITVILIPDSSAAEKDHSDTPRPVLTSEIATYNKVVIASGPDDCTATLNVQLDPEIECVIEVRGRPLTGMVTVGIRRPAETRLLGDYQSAAGIIWRWKVRGLSSVDVDFHSSTSFRFELASIKVTLADETSKDLPLSRICSSAVRIP